MTTALTQIARMAATGTAVLLAPALAFAHHPTGGMTPQTFGHGLLSGIGHPVLGPDHLAFIIGIGVLMAVSRRWQWLPAAFVATLIPGVLLHAASIDIGPAEVIVALSVALVGLAVLNEDRMPAALVIGAVMAAGLFHGHAFGETIVGAEPAPIIAYLAGLSAMIAATTLAVAWVGRQVLARGLPSGWLQRAAAAVLLAGGVLLTMQGLVG
jgi:urease accessory protein